MPNKKILVSILVILIALVSAWLILGQESFTLTRSKVIIVTDKSDYSPKEPVMVTIDNDTPKNICFSSCYPYLLEKKEGEWATYLYKNCDMTNIRDGCVKANETKVFEIILPLVEAGIHRIAVPICLNNGAGQEFKEEERFYSNEFTVK